MTIETSEGRNMARGFCRVTGEADDQNPYRSELTGALLGLVLVQCITHGCGSSPVRRVFACDNVMCVDKSFCHDGYPSIQHQHYDLLWAIHERIDTIPFPIQGEHV